MRLRILTASLLVMGTISGCSTMGVEPWEREVLAKDEMQLTSDE